MKSNLTGAGFQNAFFQKQVFCLPRMWITTFNHDTKLQLTEVRLKKTGKVAKYINSFLKTSSFEVIKFRLL